MENNLVRFDNFELAIVEYKGARVINTEKLAELYGATIKNILDNFSNNKERFEEGKHYFRLEGAELAEFKRHIDNIGLPYINKYASSLILWTEKGTLRHAKILETDQAWNVYEKLEDLYFKIKEKTFDPNSLTRLDLIKIALQSEEERIKLEKENEVMKPKAEYFDELVKRNFLSNFRDTAKELQIPERKFIDWLIEKGYIYRDDYGKLKPVAKYVKEGYFVIKEFIAKSSESKAGTQTMITAAGRDFLRRAIKRNEVNLIKAI